MTDNISMFMAVNGKYFASEHIPHIRNLLESIPQENLAMLHSADFKDPTVVLILSVLLGELGVDRFMVGDIGLGVLKLLTLGGCLIWWVVDMCIISKRAKEVNFQKLNELIYQMGGMQQQPAHAPFAN